MIPKGHIIKLIKNIYINVCLVLICLFIFLIGIKGLSKSIEGISSPDELSIGDYVHFKKLTFKIDQLDPNSGKYKIDIKYKASKKSLEINLKESVFLGDIYL